MGSQHEKLQPWLHSHVKQHTARTRAKWGKLIHGYTTRDLSSAQLEHRLSGENKAMVT